MKLRVLLGAMLALGLVSSAAEADIFAANQAAALNPMMMENQPGLYGTAPVWNLIIDRNADNAYGEVALYKGQTDVTGLIFADFDYADHSASSPTSLAVGPSEASFNLSDVEIYVDSQLNSWIRAHIAIQYGSDFTTSNNYINSTPDMFFPEAYVTLYGNGNFYAKAGRQYLNFGSTMHQALNAPLTQVLSMTNATGLTAGALNIIGGLYFDATVYNGSSYGTGSTAADTAVQANGYVFDLGYTDQEADYGYNVFADYIGNIADTLTMNYGGGACVNTGVTVNCPGPFSGSAIPLTQVGGFAGHVDYHTGPFSITGDYVTATGTMSPAQWSYNGKGAQPSSWSTEVDYNFMTFGHNSTATFGYQGSADMAGFYPIGAFMPTPQTRFAVGYNYAFMKNVYLQAEYDNDQDYGTGDESIFTNVANVTTYNASGANDNTLTLRLKVLF